MDRVERSALVSASMSTRESLVLALRLAMAKIEHSMAGQGQIRWESFQVRAERLPPAESDERPLEDFRVFVSVEID